VIGLRAALVGVAAAVLVLSTGASPGAAAPGPMGRMTGGRARGLPAGRPNSDFSYDGAMFAASCAFSHARPDDPIVFPGRPGLSHRHDFFGSTETDADSTARSLRAAGTTTCDLDGDTAGYWAPALLRDGVPVTPEVADAYYRVAPGVRASKVEPYPAGLAMIGGNAHTEAPLPTSIVGWGCGRAPAVTSTIPACPIERPLDLRVTFPDCWNGHDLDSPDHVSHVAYSTRRGCPKGFPVAMPRLTLLVAYPVTGDPSGLEPASGPTMTAHADFLNAWNQAALAENVRSCLRRGVVCSVP
jgi:Domain of unknown function (DUF1996)